VENLTEIKSTAQKILVLHKQGKNLDEILTTLTEVKPRYVKRILHRYQIGKVRLQVNVIEVTATIAPAGDVPVCYLCNKPVTQTDRQYLGQGEKNPHPVWKHRTCQPDLTRLLRKGVTNAFK